jgi:hypothetical protein
MCPIFDAIFNTILYPFLYILLCATVFHMQFYSQFNFVVVEANFGWGYEIVVNLEVK